MNNKMQDHALPQAPPLLPAQHGLQPNDDWTTIEYRHPKNPPAKQKDIPKNKKASKVCPHNHATLTNPTGTQTNLNGYINWGFAQRPSSPEPSYSMQPDPPQLSLPSNSSPSQPISDDLTLTYHNP